jgi:hypothetical protein
MSNTQLKERIAQTRQEIAASSETLRTLIATCTHTERKPGDSDSATCETCDKDLGWKCEHAPDGVCHYFSEDDGQVNLTNGQSVPVPDGHDAQFETEDSCIFCQNPEERK